MKTKFFSATIMTTMLLIAAAFATPAQAQDVGNGKNFGIGLELGSPSGLTGKYYLNPKNAIQATLGLGFTDGNFMNIAVDYLFHFNLLQKSDFRLDFYVGLGAYLWYWFDNNEGSGNDDKDAWGLGLRIPIGLSLPFKKLPLEVFLEVAPGFSLLGRTGFGIAGALGLRWYF